MHESNLYIEDDTTAREVVGFVADRAREPLVIDGETIVFNFHNSSLDVQAARDLDGGLYIVPFAVSSTWAYMSRLLPTYIKTATPLSYDSEDERYIELPQYHEMSIDSEIHAHRQEVRRAVSEDALGLTGGSDE